MKGGGKCATNEQEAETGMGAVSERTKPDHRGRAMPEVSALMQAELPGAGDRLPAFFEKGEKTKMKLELIKASDVEIKEVEWRNALLAEDKPTEDLDELLLRLCK